MKFLKYFEKLKISFAGYGAKLIKKKSVSLTDDVARENFNKIKEVLERDCKPFLKELEDSNLLFRGCEFGDNRVMDNLYKKVTRPNRKPLSTYRKIHDEFDDIFEEKHGIRIRSTGVFTTKKIIMADGYGEETFLAFPIGDFKCYWFEGISDFWVEMKDWKSAEYYEHGRISVLYDVYGKPENLSDDEFDKWIEDKDAELINDFYYDLINLSDKAIQGDMGGVLDEEVILLCDEYYIVDIKLVRFFWEWLDVDVVGLSESVKHKHIKKFRGL